MRGLARRRSRCADDIAESPCTGTVSRMPVPDGIHVRPMRAADIPDGLRLCRASRWNQVARDWAQFLALAPDGALVACRGAHVIGSVATVRYPPDTAWVAMVLVDPDERGRGIGRALLEQGLSLVDDVAVVGLDATPAGRPLYLTLGFEDAFGLRRMQRNASRSRSESIAPGTRLGVRPLDLDDWPAVLRLDRRVTRLDREDMLRWLWSGAPSFGWVHPTAGTDGLDGFVLGRQGEHFEHLGPIVAADLSVAQVLVDAALGQVSPDRPVVIDAASPPVGWQAWLEDQGFEEQRPFTRMYRGEGARRQWAPGLFAIIGPEFG